MIKLKTAAVFDCNIFVQAFLNRKSAAFACFEKFEQGQITLFVAAAVINEVNDVLHRPRIRQLSPNATTEDIRAFLERILRNAILLQNVPEEFRFERDPKDEIYVNLALVADADFIVSYDKDLLDLMREDLADGQQFRLKHPFLKIVVPAIFLQRLK